MPSSKMLPFLVLMSTIGAAAQGLPAAVQRSFDELVARVEQGTATDSQRVRIRWSAAADVAGGRDTPTRQQTTVLERQRGYGPLARERDPQLSPDHLVIVSTDSIGRELDWRVVADPRLLRGETGDAQGRIERRTFRRTEADLLVDLPDDPAITRLRVYEVQWADGRFVLQLLVTVDLQ